MSRRTDRLSRWICLSAAWAVLAAGCGPKGQTPPATKPSAGAPAGSLAWAVSGDWRSPADRARDVWRHPLQTLTFWGLKPGLTVVEMWPGAGWYSDIIAPYLARNGGRFIAAQFAAGPGADPAEVQIVQAYRARLAGRPTLYGDGIVSAFGASSGPLAPPASADLVLMRNVHTWMAAGIADKAFRDAYAVLKPGGVLGVEESRADPGGVQDSLAADGYVQQAYVVQLAQEAGFRFDGASEINANPKDDHHHPFGAATLPPTRLSAPPGRPDDPSFDHAPYDAIGESDRMTLRFVKPKPAA